jgi:hypothetical protein
VTGSGDDDDDDVNDEWDAATDGDGEDFGSGQRSPPPHESEPTISVNDMQNAEGGDKRGGEE